MDVEELKVRLAAIVDRRQNQLPRVAEQLDRLDRIERALAQVKTTANELPADWATDPVVRDSLERLRDPELGSRLTEARALLRGVEARFSRESINVGVSGRARVGKSMMLRSVSGLTDEQVPTGEGTNVTAVRSRIFHASRPRAYITFHTQTSFLDDVVRPYYRDLAVSPLPPSVSAFTAQNLRNIRDGATDSGTSTATRDRWASLIEIQDAVPQLRLDGGELTLEDDLSDLRRYVAYPRTVDKDREDSGGAPAPRDYLAVKDCRIEAPFPVTALDRLGLVDLPGLGEVASGIDGRIMAGLREEVDVVLLVFRAAVGLTNIDQIDVNALDLITQAQGSISDSRDFAWIVVNAGAGDDERKADLLSQIQRRINDRDPDSRHLVLTANAMDGESMHFDVLLPVLDRLAERLPEMDQEVLSGAVEAMETPLRGVQAAVAALGEAIRQVRSQSGSVRGELDQLSKQLRKDVQQSLAALKPYRLGEAFVEEYLEQIDQIHAHFREWLSDGLGSHESRDAWIAYAEGERGVSVSHRPFAITELHRLRVEVTKRYSQLDEFLNDHLVEEFYKLVCDAIAGDGADSVNTSEANRAYLLGDRSVPASKQVRALVNRLEACDPAVAGLASAVQRLDGIRFDFRLQSYPLLHDLNLERRPVDTNEAGEPYPPDFAEDATPYMYDWFLEEFTQFSFHVKSELRNDAQRQFKVLSGAAVVLEDEVVRSGRSEAEFRNLVDGYRDELWPGRFDEVNSTSARARQLSRAVADLSEAIDNALEVAP